MIDSAIGHALMKRLTCAFDFAVIGRMRGGVGTAKNLRLALGWSCVPGLPFLLAWGPIWILSGGALSAESDVQSVGLSVALLLYMLVSFVTVLWVPILMVVTVAEAHRLSVWRIIDTLVGAIFAVVILAAVLVNLITRYF